jgi:hypothetical protein
MKKQTNFILPAVLVVIAVLAFTGWRAWDKDERSAGQWAELDGGVYAEAVNTGGVSYLVPPDEVYASGLSAEDRPALTDPSVVDILTADSKLADDLEGIAVSVGSEHRFYAFQILNWHEVVNTEVNGTSLVVTYSPLTGSAVVYQDERSFAYAGKVYNNATLLTADGSETLWNQTTGQAIVGDVDSAPLNIYPSAVMTWAAWKDLHPSGLALSVETGFARDYGRHPYAAYETSSAIFFPVNHTFARLESKDLVYRVEDPANRNQPIVFLERYLPAQEDANEMIGVDAASTQIVALYDEDNDTVRVFNRGSSSFTQKGGVITDNETGSRWSPAGVALSGELRGQALVEIPVTRHYAFAHFAMYPNSVVSGEELLPTEDIEEEGEVLEIN